MRDTCATCLRPIWQDDTGWHHIDSTFDAHPDHAHFCELLGAPRATLYDQDKVPA